MPEVPVLSRLLRFGAFEVDMAAGQLHKSGVRVSLREKSFQVLAALLEHPGQAVSRETLRRRLWPDDVFVDFDNNLNAAIARLREALGDRADHPRFIETLPKHGYRFIGDAVSAAQAPQAATPQRARLLVLPFVNSSGDRTQDYFADAVTDELITELARLAPDSLAVIARTTSMHYKKSQKDVARIGRELGVDLIVEGSVQLAGDRVRVNVQLVQAGDQSHVWAERYDVPLGDLFATEQTVAWAIARALGLTSAIEKRRAETDVARQTRKPPTRDLVAYSEYIRGRHVLGTVTPDTLGQARRYFEAAISRDPEFALAHDSLADVYSWLGYFGFMRPIEAFSTGMLSAARALELDGTLAETHALLAQFHKQLNYDWAEVERGMARAMELDPNSSLVRARLAWHWLMPQGRLAEAVTELESALERDPLSTSHRTMLAVTLLLWRRFDRATEEARRILDLDPIAYWAHLVIGASALYGGRFDDAIAAERRALDVSGGTAAMTAWLGLSLGLVGQKAESRRLLERLGKMSDGGYVPPTSFAWIHLGLGEVDAAFEWLDRAVDERDQFMMPIKSYGFFDAIRTDPRFDALLGKMNLGTPGNVPS